MGTKLLRASVRKRFLVAERRHACAILAADFRDEFQDIMDCLDTFKLVRSEIVVGGGGKSKVAARFDDFFESRGWTEKSTKIAMTIDGVERTMDTHKVDFCKSQVAVEVEWNNKDPFYSRDLNSFRLLHELGAISVGVMITRCDELQDLFNQLGHDTQGHKIGAKYGASTTHWSKLMPRVEAGGGGSCPLLLFGITRTCYEDDMPRVPLRARA
jgi:hypothetical protein